MSEFSESFHMLDADPRLVEERLDGLFPRGGWLFPAMGRWTTFVPSGYGLSETRGAIASSVPVPTVEYMNAEDHAWQIGFFGPGVTEVTYNWDLAAGRRTEESDKPATVTSSLAAAGVAFDVEPVLRMLRRSPRVALENNGHRIAGALGLVHYRWVSGHYLYVMAESGEMDQPVRMIGTPGDDPLVASFSDSRPIAVSPRVVVRPTVDPRMAALDKEINRRIMAWEKKPIRNRPDLLPPEMVEEFRAMHAALQALIEAERRKGE